MRIGYACLTVGMRNTELKKCMLRNANIPRLIEITEHNLNSLENMIDYNIRNNIHLFRISSDLIPFASRPDYPFSWQEQFANRLEQLGERAKKNAIRLSMHPGQYTVLNSPNKDVVERAIADLYYHSNLLDSMGLGTDSKIILHVGGVYQDKKEAINRFIINYGYLNDSVKQRLVLENDDKSYNIQDVLDIGTKINIPVVFDNLHHFLNPSNRQGTDAFWIQECKKTWKESDGCQKIHYSQQELLKKSGSHSSTIRVQEFLDFYKNIERQDIDIMLEVKDKNLSAVKCILCLSDEKSISALEKEWSKYKYSVLEKAPENYLEIRMLLKNKNEYPTVAFYTLVDDALFREYELGKTLNAIQHVWGYFKDLAAEKEKISFINMIEKFKRGTVPASTIKNFLWKLAKKYQQNYLLDSYYFEL